MKDKNAAGFYHNLITGKSWKQLLKLRKKYKFILIGGWAVYLYTKALKSKDIDIVVDHEELAKLKEDFEVNKNPRLKKYEARSEEVEIDVYVPFYSNPGIPAEYLKDYTPTLEGFNVPEKEILAILKEKALSERVDSIKGKKDLIDLVAIFRMDAFDWQKYRQVLKKFDLEKYSKLAKEVIGKARQIEELDLNIHKMARLKKKILPNL